jgi:putative transposase
LILSYKFRVYPNRAQRDGLATMLGAFCDLYNAALQQRIEAYQRRGISLHFYDQTAELKAVRAVDERLASFSFTAEAQVLRRLDKAFKAFFRRVKARQNPGFPRFRAKARYRSAEYPVGDGLTLRKSGRVGIVGIPGEIKVKWHRELPTKPKSAILTRQCGKWHVIFHVEVESAPLREGERVGIDVGLVSLAALSNSETVERPNWTTRAAKGLRRRQRALARCTRGSKRRIKAKARLARYFERIANRRRDHLHKVSTGLVNRFPRIAVEDIDFPADAPSRRMRRDIYDAAWGMLISMLDYKAAKAGGLLVKVDPRGTSERCSGCGSADHKMTAKRMHTCSDCGLLLDRDINAARNIIDLAFGPGTGPRAPSRRVAA